MKSRYTILLGLCIAVITVFSSCQKEVSFQVDDQGDGGDIDYSTIIGDYEFVGAAITTRTVINVSDGIESFRFVTTTDYTTENNTGTAKITSTEVQSINSAYSVNAVVNTKTYIDGVLFDDSDEPFAYDQPTYSTTSGYTLNSADSLTYAGQAFASPLDPSGGTPPVALEPLGAKISWSGDTLLLKTVINYSRPYDLQGVLGTLVGEGTSTVKLKRL